MPVHLKGIDLFFGLIVLSLVIGRMAHAAQNRLRLFKETYSVSINYDLIWQVYGAIGRPLRVLHNATSFDIVIRVYYSFVSIHT